MDIFNTVAGTASIIGLLLAIAGFGGCIYSNHKKKNQIQKIKGDGNVVAGRDINLNK